MPTDRGPAERGSSGSADRGPTDNAQNYLEIAAASGDACLNAALSYIALGWSALGICPPSHLGVGKAHGKTCQSAGKAPWGAWKEFQDRVPTDQEIRQKWRDCGYLNVGMAYGPVSGLVGIDIDGEGGEELLKSKGETPPTLEFVTPGGGRRLLYKIPPGAILRTTYESPKAKQELRFQAKGAQTVMPPSRHANGGVYSWVPGKGPGEIEPAPAPAWLIAELSEGKNGHHVHTNGSSRFNPEVLKGAHEGSRNTSAASLIGKLLSGLRHLDADSVIHVHELVFAWNDARNDPPMPDDELEKTFQSILEAEKKSRLASDADLIAAVAAEEIQQSCEQAPLIVSSKNLPPWHLIQAGNNPTWYYLRAPYWNESPRLQNGYLKLTSNQVQNWTATGDNIKKAAFDQAGIVDVPKKIPKWDTSGNLLSKLVAAGEVRGDKVPERNRVLYVLGFVCRYLMMAKAPVEKKDGTFRNPPIKIPVIIDDVIRFKLASLKTALHDAREAITQTELIEVISEDPYGFRQKQWQNSKWWEIANDSFAMLKKLTQE